MSGYVLLILREENCWTHSAASDLGLHCFPVNLRLPPIRCGFGLHCFLRPVCLKTSSKYRSWRLVLEPVEYPKIVQYRNIRNKTDIYQTCYITSPHGKGVREQHYFSVRPSICPSRYLLLNHSAEFKVGILRQPISATEVSITQDDIAGNLQEHRTNIMYPGFSCIRFWIQYLEEVSCILKKKKMLEILQIVHDHVQKSTQEVTQVTSYLKSKDW